MTRNEKPLPNVHGLHDGPVPRPKRKNPSDEKPKPKPPPRVIDGVIRTSVDETTGTSRGRTLQEHHDAKRSLSHPLAPDRRKREPSETTLHGPEPAAMGETSETRNQEISPVEPVKKHNPAELVSTPKADPNPKPKLRARKTATRNDDSFVDDDAEESKGGKKIIQATVEDDDEEEGEPIGPIPAKPVKTSSVKAIPTSESAKPATNRTTRSQSVHGNKDTGSEAANKATRTGKAPVSQQKAAAPAAGSSKRGASVVVRAPAEDQDEDQREEEENEEPKRKRARKSIDPPMITVEGGIDLHGRWAIRRYEVVASEERLELVRSRDRQESA
ncbi:hypothetical protein CLAFUW4_12565 [Fulvia fulva]|uniref:Uncharacterized protein n=1 Tax=Passalora fulva TaxID=5499 RepID=A0A9Q8PDY1_PASFU|nr:uncharacterized protein CLAFUR5_11590 [Fulvia fulva]KAK4617624.1 hypothetical protein CLAFUR4_12570 [Fulvia fulva]KAK4619193.1 hypothetical protein CLAFUR0_12581 [Fulvia fulva]UJO20685.1 hypothetical protein CLAFUR5_11590 [Fulvia fulva]WPV18477.1 hypothetical protein CLAFUW4_12565 [Fulvia fulva]WPV33093.1 hypothetical protein CLAFUW7_12572 [Fulvia fulva]